MGIYPELKNSSPKGGVKLDSLVEASADISKTPVVWDEPAVYQVVGGVKAYQAYDG